MRDHKERVDSVLYKGEESIQTSRIFHLTGWT
jgi:hypothetical protein